MAKQTYASLRKNENCPIACVCLMCARITFVSLRETKRVENRGLTNWHKSAEECQFVVSVTVCGRESRQRQLDRWNIPLDSYPLVPIGCEIAPGRALLERKSQAEGKLKCPAEISPGETLQLRFWSGEQKKQHLVSKFQTRKGSSQSVCLIWIEKSCIHFMWTPSCWSQVYNN